jgi:PAS domain-containing protein
VAADAALALCETYSIPRPLIFPIPPGVDWFAGFLAFGWTIPPVNVAVSWLHEALRRSQRQLSELRGTSIGLRESEDRYRALVEASPDGIYSPA